MKDDGSAVCYKARLEQYYKKLEDERSILNVDLAENEDYVINGQLKIPSSIWNNLYR